jgi:hypothetical protein
VLTTEFALLALTATESIRVPARFQRVVERFWADFHTALVWRQRTAPG